MTALRSSAPWIVALLLWMLAGWSRIRGMATATVLSDQLGPWWVALSGPPWWEPHAPLYGWGLVWPYWLIATLSDSLWTAITGLLWLHALAAPLAFFTTWLHAGSRTRWAGSILVGLAVALDPGLIDIALSGSKAYLSVVWVGVMTLGIVAHERRWGPVLAWVGFAMAVMNHPLAICCFPMLFVFSWRERRVRLAMLLAGLLLLPSLIWFSTHSVPTTGELEASVVSAFRQLWSSSPWTTGMVFAGLGLGLSQPADRRFAVAVSLAWLILVVFGFLLGYLRDYHLRIMMIPSLVGWVGLPGHWPLLGALFLRLPAHPVSQPSRALQPGSLGLTQMFTDQVWELSDDRIVVDGAWISASLAAEPAAMTLDLWLRGRPAEGFGPGGVVILIVSAERGQGQNEGDIDHAIGSWSGEPLIIGDRYFLARAGPEQVRSWSAEICRSRAERGLSTPRLGGAWDGLIVLQPELTSVELGTWWDCP